MSRRSDECTKHTLEKSCSFEIMTDTYNLLNGSRVGSIKQIYFVLIIVFV